MATLAKIRPCLYERKFRRRKEDSSTLLKYSCLRDWRYNTMEAKDSKLSYVWMLACELRTVEEQQQFGFVGEEERKDLYVVVKRRCGFQSEIAGHQDLCLFLHSLYFEDRSFETRRSADSFDSFEERYLYEGIVTGERRYIKIVDADPFSEQEWRSNGGYVWYHVLADTQEDEVENSDEILDVWYGLFRYSTVIYSNLNECYRAAPNSRVCDMCSRTYGSDGVIVIDDMRKEL